MHLKQMDKVLNSKDLAKAATLLKEGLETYLKLNKE